MKRPDPLRRRAGDHPQKNSWAFNFAGDRLFVLGSIPGCQRLVYRGAHNQLFLLKP